MRAGRKGIGRFAAERLGRTLVLTTRAVRDLPGLQLKVNWDDFAPGRELAHVPVIVELSVGGPQGTTLRIERLRDYWTDAQKTASLFTQRDEPAAAVPCGASGRSQTR